MKKLLLISLLISGCTIRSLGEVSIISTKEINMEVEHTRLHSNIEGKSVQPIVVFFPTRMTPTIEEAVNDALLKSGGDYMLNSSIKMTNWYIPYIYGQNIITVEGEIWKNNQTNSNYLKIINNNSSKIKFDPETGEIID